MRHPTSPWPHRLLGAAGVLLVTLPLQAQTTGGPSPAGRWVAGCHKLAVFHKLYGVESVTFSGANRFEREIKEYQAPDCNEAGLIDVRGFSGSYALGQKAGGSNPDTARNVDFTIEASVAAAFGAEAIKEFNDTRVCGKVDWRTGLRRSTLGGDCPGQTLTAGTVIYDLIDVTGDQAFFGATSYFRDASAPKTRPAKLDFDRPFVRVQGPAAAAH